MIGLLWLEHRVETPSQPVSLKETVLVDFFWKAVWQSEGI